MTGTAHILIDWSMSQGQRCCSIPDGPLVTALVALIDAPHCAHR